MDSFNNQTLLGISNFDVDLAQVDTLIVNKDLSVLGDANILNPVFPSGAILNKVLTCSSSLGNAVWANPADAALSGDCTGTSSNNRVDTLAGGTLPVNALVTLNGLQTLSNKIMDSFTVSGVETLQKNMWFNNQGANKIINLWDAGNFSDQTLHNFYGFGIGSSTMRYQVGSLAAAHVFYSAANSTTSNELLRIGGNGLITIPGTLKIPTGAGLAKVLTSDPSGNAFWADPAEATSVGNLTMSGYLFNPAGRYLLANNTSSSSLFLGEGGNNLITGQCNVICGPSMYNMTTGSYNTAIGTSVSPPMTTAFYTTAAGYQSLPTLTTGNSNTAFGVDAGRGITTGANNTFLGTETNATVGSISGSTCIGSGAYVTTSNTVALGGSNVTNVYTSGTINSPALVSTAITGTAISAVNFNSGGYRAPTVQGTYVTWNRSGSSGKATWGNQKGGGSGGHEWVDYNIGTGVTTVNMSLDGNLLTLGGVNFPKNGAFGNTLNYYEEYAHVTVFLGPVISDIYQLKITQIGRHVTLYMPNGPAFVATTAGVIGWTIGIKLPERFRPTDNVNSVVVGKNNGVTTLLNVLVDSLGGVTLSVALTSTAWVGNIGFNAFSLCWSLGI